MYKAIGKIDSFDEIPWDEPVIIAGSIGKHSRSWFWKMPGVFRKGNDDFRFLDDCGIATRFERNDSISLSLLELV
jgi:hypothetical protein